MYLYLLSFLSGSITYNTLTAFLGYLSFSCTALPTLLTVMTRYLTWNHLVLILLTVYNISVCKSFLQHLLISNNKHAARAFLPVPEFLLSSNLCKHPDLCFADNSWETELRCGCFVSSTLFLCYDQFLVAFNLFISTPVCVYLFSSQVDCFQCTRVFSFRFVTTQRTLVVLNILKQVIYNLFK